MVKNAFEDSDGIYGYRRIQAYLEKHGVRAGGATIRSIMHELGLQAAQPRAKVCTTMPADDLDGHPDLVGRDFTADEPGRKWCGDIPPQAGGAPSCISTWAGFVYLATVLDCCTKKVVGYAMAEPCAHLAGVRGHRHGGQKVPGRQGRDSLSLGPGEPVHVSEVPGPPEVLWYPPVRGTDRSVLGGCVGGILQRHAQERESA